MADKSNIAWTRSTFNPWIGCTKVGPGCDGCYAEALDTRMQFGGGQHWGPGVPRYRTKPGNWAKPLQWNKQAAKEREAGIRWSGAPDMPPGFWPVFCASLGDVFDNEVPQDWRDDLWRLINQTPHLSWLLVTKRIGNVAGMVPSLDWLRFHDNVRILITVVNQEEADRDIPKLLALPCKNGISYEPALGPVDWARWLGKQCDGGSVPGPYGIGGVTCPRCMGNTGRHDCQGLEWIIVGGESNQGQHKARPFNIGWARSTVQQCKAAGVPVFVKQIGSQPRGWCKNMLLDESALMSEPYCDNFEAHEQASECGRCVYLEDRAGADPEEWPSDLRIREFPR